MRLVFLVRPGKGKIALEKPGPFVKADYVVSLTAQATENEANRQLIEFLVTISGVSKGQIRLSGLKSRRKTVEGIDKSKIEKWFETHRSGY